MHQIKKKLTEQEIKNAYFFENFRSECKSYLWEHNKAYDKFTIVSHDSFIGYITEYFIKGLIQEKFPSLNLRTWEQDFNLWRIQKIIQEKSILEDDINYVKEYFYDKWDLKISNSDGKEILIDVKTALTQKIPSKTWNFFYPVIQANKQWKDWMILSYYVVDNTDNIESLNSIYVAWYISEDIIKQCKIIHAGEKSNRGTTSQIDNYYTELSLHYSDIELMIKNLL